MAAALTALVFLGLASCSGRGTPEGPGGATVYAALGASDAVGVGAVPLSNGYVYLIAERIRAARGEVELHNFGYLGARIDHFLDSELPAAIAVAPGVVTVWAGSNDLIEGDDAAVFGAKLESLLRQLREGTAAQVFVGDLVDLTRAPRFRRDPSPAVTRARIAAFNAGIHAAVAATGAHLVPLSTVPLDDSLFAWDGFHPSNAGYALLAAAFWQEMAGRI